jgi:alanyl-tRNA synthetase
MTTSRLVELYIEFFRGKGHSVIPGASLIPENDSTILFTPAGMQPLVPYLLGGEHPVGRRLVNVQKCIRTGDIDSVGDPRTSPSSGCWATGPWGTTSSGRP